MEAVTFTLEGKELEAATVWRDTHPCDLGDWPTTGRAYFSYTFTPAGPGTTIVVRCSLCEQSCNVTDFDCW